KLSLIDATNGQVASGDSALRAVAGAIQRGQIVALKGIGGFQLIVNALDEAAVGRLRERKHRPDKPFALMFPSLEVVRKYCALCASAERALSSEAAPIVLLERLDRPGSNRPALAGNVALGNPRLGVMLPNSPLHSLLLAGIDGPVVCTSGNLSNEPICIETEEANGRLAKIADLFLTHDRAVVRPIDDSVVSANARGIRMIRRARGYAPVAIDLATGGPVVLALGGHLKNTVALAVGRQVVMSQHIGDLDNASARTALRRAIDDLRSFFPCRIDLVACDLHPDYASTIVAEQLAAEVGAPLLRVQHHHAHLAAVAAEHRLEEPVLGFAWDGSGYGLDGSIWGGEAIVVRGAGFERVATMRSFRLVGGESAIREPRRCALGILHAAGLKPPASVLRWFEGDMADRLGGVLERRLNAPVTSSIGRMFDAIAALCGVRGVATFEGQAAMELEYALDAGAEREGAYPVMVRREDGLLVGDWKPLLEAVVADLRVGIPISRISARFHNALAAFALEIAQAARLSRIALGGGCFQNEYLLHRVTERLESAGFQVYAPARIPTNDGGIAFGQVAAARQAARESEYVPSGSR
ncbi:MAG TPA: carbamoyltransferase HypF, partial [Candidatus Binataceae bacterium]|nr:carbamoyltransferase HypF [Candidatus Binataceae bacterium]